MDEIVLTLPRERDFYRIAHLVLGGVAARRNLTYEHLEDLQLALDSLLERRDRDGEITVRLSVGSDRIRAEIGPLDPAVAGELEPESGGDIGLRRILDTVADEVELSDRGGDAWVSFTKSIAAGGEA